MKPIKSETLYTVIIILLVIIAFMLFFFIKGYMDYAQWKSYRDYFKQPNPQIQSWMSVSLISTKFNLTKSQIYNDMGVNGSQINNHITLDLYCQQYHKDCSSILEKLNSDIKI